jgi:hypothetical protein
MAAAAARLLEAQRLTAEAVRAEELAKVDQFERRCWPPLATICERRSPPSRPPFPASVNRTSICRRRQRLSCWPQSKKPATG